MKRAQFEKVLKEGSVVKILWNRSPVTLYTYASDYIFVDGRLYFVEYAASDSIIKSNEVQRSRFATVEEAADMLYSEKYEYLRTITMLCDDSSPLIEIMNRKMLDTI